MYADLAVLNTFQKGAFCATADVSSIIILKYLPFIIYL